MTTELNVNDLSGKELKRLIERGILGITKNQPIPTKIEETPEWKKYKNLHGNEIAIREASRKYDVSPTTIRQWTNRGIIPVIREDGYRKFLDESYVAYCVEVKRQRNGAGKWLFDENGLPYTPTSRSA